MLATTTASRKSTAFLFRHRHHCLEGHHHHQRQRQHCLRLFSTLQISDELSSKLHDPTLLTDWKPPIMMKKTATRLTNPPISEVSMFTVLDPAFSASTSKSSPSLLAQVPSSCQDHALESINLSHQAFQQWKDGTTASQRASLLQEWKRLMLEESTQEDLATIMTMEAGKPLTESQGEIKYAASFLDYYAGEATRPTNGGFLVPTPFQHSSSSSNVNNNDNNESDPFPLLSTPAATTAVPSPGSTRGQIIAKYQPVGVCAMITPWNFPSAMITRKVAPCLAAGCTAILKPSELTPLSAIALHTLAMRAGIPPTVFQILPTNLENTPDIGMTFCQSTKIQKISFTGSTNVGKTLLTQSANTVKRMSMELGGNAPFIVFEHKDADDMDRIILPAVMGSKFRNAGQTCVCADRFLIHSSIYEQFIDKLVVAVKDKIVMGNGLKDGTTMGPLISQKAVNTVHTKVQEAINMGATLHLGGSRHKGKNGKSDNDHDDDEHQEQEQSSSESQFYEPTILSDVPLDSELWKSETFGPVVAIRSFETEEEALELANDSSVGLAAYFCTKDMEQAFRVADRLECGLVGVNEGIISNCAAPFGGVKESGLGREGSPMGLAEYLETKYMFMNY